MAQFIIQVNQAVNGWTVQIKNQSTGAILNTCILPCSTSVLGQPYPLPPQERMQTIPASDALRALCVPENEEQREDLLERLLEHENQPGDVSLLGRFLFETLIGIENWKAVVAQAGGGEIELVLSWQPGEAVFNHLPWETMHPGSGQAGLDPLYQGRFLAACSRVTIYRRVEGTQGKIDSIQTPPRVLFVIGTELNKDVIRPGAEYLGLLRRLNSEGQAIHSRILFSANLDSLSEAVQEYRPHVVHFICHGVTAPGQKPYLVMNPSDPQKEETKNVTASRLAEVFKELQPAPILVINACSMAAIQEPKKALESELELSRPFTTELVELGLPVVLGMAGRITDQACRMFTQGFYHALLKDGRIAHAASLGRRAAIVKGGVGANNQVDWALPVLFLSAAMENAQITLAGSPALLNRQRAANEFTPARTEPFCDRLDMLRQYEYLMRPTNSAQGGEKKNFPDAPRPVQVLAVYNVHQSSSPGQPAKRFGRTWMLEEMAAQAVRDGHVPVLVSLKQTIGANNYPHTLREYMNGQEALFPLAMYTTFKILMKTEQYPNFFWKRPEYLKLLLSLNPGVPTPQAFLDGTPFPDEMPFNPDNPSAPLMVGKILAMELKKFLEGVRAQRPEAERAGIRMLLLIDDLHRMEDFGQDLLTVLNSDDIRAMINDLRMVVTYEALSSSGDNKPMISTLLEAYTNNFWVQPVQLPAFHRPFDTNWPEDEWIKAKLVYEQYMLQWLEKNTKKNKPYVFNHPEKNEEARRLIKQLAKRVQGIPSWLRLGDDWIFDAEEDLHHIHLANDDEVLAQTGE